MLGFVKDKFLYIKAPKNGCMTYSNILYQNGWQEINLFENSLDMSSMFLWGHLTNPETRHTKGVEQYLRFNRQIEYKNKDISRLLVSAVFDEHTYSLNMMMGPIMHFPIYWIPLDADVYNYREGKVMSGDDLTSDFFKEQKIDITISDYPKLNVANNAQIEIRKFIDDCKNQYTLNYQKLVKNFLEPDILLYNKTVATFRQKYE